MTDWGLAAPGEADGRKGSHCTAHLSSPRDKKKGALETTSNSGQSPVCGHSEQGTPQNNYSSDLRQVGKTVFARFLLTAW